MTTETTDAAFAELAALNAFQLSLRAECASPDSLESPGAIFLASIRDAVAEMIGEDPTIGDDDAADRCADIAAEAPDVYTYTRWQEFTDLAAWQEDPSELVSGEDMTAAAGVCLYMIAERLARSLFDEWRGTDETETD